MPAASARKLARNNVCVIEDANHMQVCQPVDEFHESYRTLLQFVKEIRKQNQQVKTNEQPDFGDESSSKSAPPISMVRKCSDELELG